MPPASIRHANRNPKLALLTESCSLCTKLTKCAPHNHHRLFCPTVLKSLMKACDLTFIINLSKILATSSHSLPNNVDKNSETLSHNYNFPRKKPKPRFMFPDCSNKKSILILVHHFFSGFLLPNCYFLQLVVGKFCTVTYEELGKQEACLLAQYEYRQLSFYP